VITQGLLEWLAGLLGTLVLLVPPLPDVFADALETLAGAGSYIGQTLSLFSPVLPLDAFAFVILTFIALMAWWALLMAIRFTLWALGR